MHVVQNQSRVYLDVSLVDLRRPVEVVERHLVVLSVFAPDQPKVLEGVVPQLRIDLCKVECNQMSAKFTRET